MEEEGVTTCLQQLSRKRKTRAESLEATKMGAPVYRRLGYREVLRYHNYWPADVPG